MAYKIQEIQAVGAPFAKKLKAAKIESTEDLLNRCSGPQGRVATAAETGISEKELLKWANIADLMRVSGVGNQYAELLEDAGVDTIKELRMRVASNLSAKLEEINKNKKLVRATPSAHTVQEWIDQAKKTEPRIMY